MNPNKNIIMERKKTDEKRPQKGTNVHHRIISKLSQHWDRDWAVTAGGGRVRGDHWMTRTTARARRYGPRAEEARRCWLRLFRSPRRADGPVTMTWTGTVRVQAGSRWSRRTPWRPLAALASDSETGARRPGRGLASCQADQSLPESKEWFLTARRFQ